jgi:hypothetical protein
MNAIIKGISSCEIESRNQMMKIVMERDSITLISFELLKGYNINRITAKTMNGDLNKLVTVNNTPNKTMATREIIISYVL